MLHLFSFIVYCDNLNLGTSKLTQVLSAMQHWQLKFPVIQQVKGHLQTWFPSHGFTSHGFVWWLSLELWHIPSNTYNKVNSEVNRNYFLVINIEKVLFMHEKYTSICYYQILELSNTSLQMPLSLRLEYIWEARTCSWRTIRKKT